MAVKFSLSKPALGELSTMQYKKALGSLRYQERTYKEQCRSLSPGGCRTRCSVPTDSVIKLS